MKNDLHNVHISMDALRQRVTSRLIPFAFFTLAGSIIFSIARIPVMGLRPFMVVHVAITVAMAVLYMERRRVHSSTAGLVMIGFLSLVLATGVAGMGLLSATFIIAPVISMYLMLLGYRTWSFASIGIILAYVAIIAVLHITGTLKVPVDADQYIKTIGAWAIIIVAVGAISIAFVMPFESVPGALEGSEERFRVSFEHSNVGMCLTSLEGRMLKVNSAFATMIGYETGELEGKSFTDLTYPEDREIGRSFLDLATTHAAVNTTFEKRYLHKDGGFVWARVAISLIHDKAGNPQYFITHIENITERRRVEDDLRLSEERFRKLFEESPIGIAFLDKDRNIVLTNKSYRDFLGYSQEEIRTIGARGVLHPDDWDRSMEESVKLRTGAIPLFHLEQRYIRKDGSVVWSDTHITPVKDKNGEIIHTIGWTQDITERKRIEHELRKSEIRYRLLTENMTDVLWVLDLDTMRFTYMSPSVERLRGYTVDEVMNQTLDQVLTPDSYALLQSLLRQRLEAFRVGQGLVKNYRDELEQPKKDGTTVWTEVTTTTLMKQDGGIEVIGVSRDITERKRAEEELRQSESRYRALIENSPDIIARFDSEGKYLFVNSAVTRVSTLTPSEFVGKTLWEVDFTAEQAAERDRLVKKVFSSGKPMELEMSLDRHDGRRLFEWRAFPEFDGAGIVRSVVTINRDITDRKSAEDALNAERNLLNVLLTNTPDHIYFKDKESRFLRLSASQAFKFGIQDPAEAVGKTDFDFFSEEHARLALEDEREVIATGRAIVDKEEKETWMDGRETWVSTSKMPIKDSRGLTIGTFGISRDITEKKLAEMALRASESRFRELWHSTVEGIAIHEGGIILEVNDAACRMFGYTVEQVVGKSMLEFAPPEIRDMLRSRFASPVDGQFEIPAVRSDGKKLLLDVYSKQIEYKGKRARMVAVHDITVRKEAEEALRESEAKLRAMFEGSRDAIGVSKNGIHIFANPSYLRLFGFHSDADIVGTSILQSIAPAFRKQVAEHVESRSSGKSAPKSYEGRGVRVDGTEFEAEFNVSTYELNGEIYSLVVIRDITERKRAEEQIRKLSLAVEQSPASIVITDLKGNIEYVNPKFTRVTGYTFDEIIGKNPRILKSGETPLEEYSAMWTTISSGKEWRGEFHNKKKNGELFWESASISPVKDQDNIITNFIAVKEDITDRKRAEEALRQAQKLESIGTLASGIAHDFNNVLAGIMGYTEMSLRYAENGSVLDKNLKRVLKATERARQLIRQIQTFSRKNTSQNAVISLKPVIEEALDLLRASIPSSVIINERLEEQTANVVADPVKIHEALLNLATNGVLAMNKKGTLTVRLYSERLDRTIYGQRGEIARGDYTILEVTDNGCGMDSVTQARAFEPFFTSRAVGEGTGMGLSVVLGIVQSLGGDIHLSSEVGRGSTFTLYFPATAGSPTGLRDEAASVRLTGTERILFVDDEETLVEMTREILSKFGYTVSTYTNSLDALTFLNDRRNGIDLLITDQTMPHMTGVELAKAVRKVRHTLPIILCTGLSNDLDPKDAAAISVNRIVLKPYRANELGAAVRDVLETRKGAVRL